MFTESTVKDLLSKQCPEIFHVSTKRPGILQVAMPFYYEDGDAVEIFVENGEDGLVRITDYGMALMRLSYAYDMDSPTKEGIFNTIVTENRLREKSGAIYIDVAPEELYPGLLAIANGVAKIGSMKYFRKEMVKNLFYDDVERFITEKLVSLNPSKRVCPIPDRDDLEVDFVIETARHPLYIFAVRKPDKAKVTTICCLEFQKAQLSFRSVVVHENMDNLSSKDRSRLTNVVDKQYTSLTAFEQNIEMLVRRESTQ
jgi:hypothetical protein